MNDLKLELLDDKGDFKKKIFSSLLRRPSGFFYERHSVLHWEDLTLRYTCTCSLDAPIKISCLFSSLALQLVYGHLPVLQLVYGESLALQLICGDFLLFSSSMNTFWSFKKFMDTCLSFSSSIDTLWTYRSSVETPLLVYGKCMAI